MPIIADPHWSSLVRLASQFEFDDVHHYMQAVEYADWMTDIMDDPDAEMFSTNDLIRINEVLLDAFESAHHRRLGYWTRRNLTYN